jgi:mono/diheme cytochrome c family protein
MHVISLYNSGRPVTGPIIGIILLILLCSGTSFAQVSNKWIAPPEANSLEDPVAVTEDRLTKAHILYNNLCAQCHGYKGNGDCPVAGVLNPKPPDHTSDVVQSQPDGALFWKLTNGKGQMQPYSLKLTDEQRWSIIHYIRTLKK